ncbi:hypothetical protein [Streptomyces sp. NRRL S-920]|uniref:hypothetical protein n=1 Tax=Streptomyces sp. NRRL S-920 TaxID=1463921 RepID=UPI0004C583A0|nr:hypothetical protein [Streptomyces sp. NRRL S-920]
MYLHYQYAETVSAEVALHTQDVENFGAEPRTLPRHITTFSVDWINSVSWDLTGSGSDCVWVEAFFPSGAQFADTVALGLPASREIRYRASVSREMEFPALTRSFVSVVGTHEIDRALIAGDVVGTVTSSRINDLRIKMTLLTPEGDHLRTEFLGAEVVMDPAD